MIYKIFFLKLRFCHNFSVLLNVLPFTCSTSKTKSYEPSPSEGLEITLRERSKRTDVPLI
jgi:hypothetical protein